MGLLKIRTYNSRMYFTASFTHLLHVFVAVNETGSHIKLHTCSDFVAYIIIYSKHVGGLVVPTPVDKLGKTLGLKCFCQFID